MLKKVVFLMKGGAGSRKLQKGGGQGVEMEE